MGRAARVVILGAAELSEPGPWGEVERFVERSGVRRR
jgi:hypothetical protein